MRELLGFRPRSKSKHRLYTLIPLLLDTGLRIEEALRLSRDSVDLDNMILRVLGQRREAESHPDLV